MEFTQANRALRITTPLGQDVFLLTAMNAEEGISRLFELRLDVLALVSTRVDFDKLLGQTVTATIELPEGGERHFSGMVRRVAQGGTALGPSDVVCTAYEIYVVPKLWLHTLSERSRIFQQKSVPDILKEVLGGVDVDYQLQGTYQPRNYCVQYRESDFHFISRLMEEEGIFYFFVHADGKHKMVVAETPISHPELPTGSTIVFESMLGGRRDDDRIWQWEKAQEIRTGKYTLWDHNFELPQKHLDASVVTMDSATAGTVTHKLRVGGNEALEIYDFPGGYANRFDGIDPGGGERAADLQKLFEDNQRTVKIRMQQVEVGTLAVQGFSSCRQMTSGHKFKLERHENADGEYVLVSVRHEARLADVGRSGEGGFHYENQFTCIPAALPYRPSRKTPKPLMHGCQTAFVVGPAGEEIFTDKYGRVKVQFNWDREGKKDANSACWLRVATPWAGKQWGMIHIPRIGNEVVVDFLEGDPDRPIITGMVYNADSMPPYTLPDHKTQSGIKTRSSLKGGAENFNEIRFEDKKDAEEIYIHAERNKRVIVENNDLHTINRHHGMRIIGGRAVLIEGDLGVDLSSAESLPEDDSGSGDLIGDALGVEKNRYIYVGDKELHEVEKGHHLHVLDGDQELTVTTGDQITTVEDGSQTVTIKQDQSTEIQDGNHSLDVKTGNSKTEISMGNQEVKIKMGNRSIKLDLGKISEEAMQGIELKVGQSSVKIDQTGVTIKGMMVKVEGQIQAEVKGLMTSIKADAMLQAKGAITMIG